jgi:D-glycero-D-manno-heptose 1,7-bisphosphate phosphatase
LNEAGVAVVVLTNQSALARGFLSEETLGEIHAGLEALLWAQGAFIDQIYYCPHHPDDACACRKPLPGMAMSAARDFQADLRRSYVVGDNSCDMGLGKAIGATTILVRTGYGALLEQSRRETYSYVVDGLADAADTILTSMIRISGQ